MSAKLSVIGFIVNLFFHLIVGAKAIGSTVCPDWLMKRPVDLPTCPQGGLVPENYPVAAVVLSDVNGGSFLDSRFTADVVERILIAADVERIPLLILPVSNLTFEAVKARIDQLPIDSRVKQKYKAALLQLPVRGYVWQQDYMQSFVDPKSGQIILREVENYRRHGQSFGKLVEATNACGFQEGPKLQTTGADFLTGYSAGNIETLPEGICLLGDDHFSTKQRWEDYANQFCIGGADNRIQVPTSWLYIGHTDEIMKVVPNNKAKAPCNFSVVLASPKKAIELLKEKPKDKFMDFSFGRGGTPIELANKRGNSSGIQSFCREIKNQGLDFQPKYKKNNDSESPSGMTKLLNFQSLLIGKAIAKESSLGGDFQEAKDCVSITNGEVYDVLTSGGALGIYNQMVQKKMDALKLEVHTKLKRKLPQCTPDFLEVPNVFFGARPIKKENGQYELPTAKGLSVLPNPTNGIAINNTIISPDPSSSVFRNYLQEQYRQRGLKSEFVDTFDYAHQFKGNLHCATNTIHICNPL